MQEKTALQNYVKNYCFKNDITLKSIAAKLNISNGTMTKLLIGDSNLTLDILNKLTKALGITYQSKEYKEIYRLRNLNKHTIIIDIPANYNQSLRNDILQTISTKKINYKIIY